MMKTTQTTSTAGGVFRYLKRYLLRHRSYLIWGGVVVVLANVLLLISPYLIKLVYDHLESGQPVSSITGLLTLMIGSALLAGVFRYFMRRTIIWMSRILEYELRSDLTSHLLRLPATYYDSNRTGDILARLTNDLEAVRMMAGPGIMQLSNTVVSMVVALSFMIVLSPMLTLYAIAPAVVLPIVVHKLGSLTHRKFLKIQEHFSALTASVQENLSGVRVIRAYRQEEKENAAFGEMSRTYLDLNMDMGRLMAMFFPMISFVAGGLLLVVLYFGGKAVIAGQLSLGTLVAFFIYLNLLIWPMMAVGWVINLYQRGIVSLERLNQIFDQPVEKQDDRSLLYEAPMRGAVTCRSLRFSFGDTHVLREISFHLEPGQTLGMLGATGSGKTTLVSLLARLYPVERGQLFIDEIDINDWDLAALRRQIGFATQEPFLFSETIAENVRFGDGDADPDELHTAADLAALTKDVRTFPDQFETVVGERGITLSGGQKQRAAIARAALIRPAILILDDSTSAVDTETEDQINTNIRSRTPACTTIIISHRVSSVKEADLILMLDDGQICESGTHATLVARGGKYADLYQRQLMQQELEAIR